MNICVPLLIVDAIVNNEWVKISPNEMGRQVLRGQKHNVRLNVVEPSINGHRETGSS